MKALGAALLVLIAAALALAATAIPGHAATCAPFDAVQKQLAAKFSEVPVARGLVADGARLMVLFAAPNGTSWTAMIVTPEGAACMVASGGAFEELTPAPVPQGEEG